MPMVSRICNKIILMDRGESKFQGDNVSKAVDLYYTRFASNDTSIIFTDNTIDLKKIDVLTESSIEGVKCLEWGENLDIQVEFDAHHDNIKSLGCAIIILDKEQRPVASIRNTCIKLCDSHNYHLIFKHHKIQLSKGTYSINIVFTLNSSPAYRANGVINFQIIHEIDSWEPMFLDAETHYL